jgi:hypothetical protein
MSADQTLEVVSSLSSADLAAFGRLFDDLARAFPTLFVMHEGPFSYGLSPSDDYSSLDMTKALMTASKQGLRSRPCSATPAAAAAFTSTARRCRV